MSRRGHAWLQHLIAGVALMLTALACPAADLQWPGRPFQIVASEKPLPDLLRELAASQGATAVVDPKISGTISGKFSAAPLNILNSLCATYALSWYYDGTFLYIDPSADAKTEVISIGKDAGSAGWLMQTLIQLRIYDKRYPLLVSGREGTARVTGPRRYVDLVRQAARLVDQKSALDDVAEIRMFPLKYAWANDFRIARSGSTVSIAGVASADEELVCSRRERAAQPVWTQRERVGGCDRSGQVAARQQQLRRWRGSPAQALVWRHRQRAQGRPCEHDCGRR